MLNAFMYIILIIIIIIFVFVILFSLLFITYISCLLRFLHLICVCDTHTVFLLSPPALRGKTVNSPSLTTPISVLFGPRRPHPTPITLFDGIARATLHAFAMNGKHFRQFAILKNTKAQGCSNSVRAK